MPKPLIHLALPIVLSLFAITGCSVTTHDKGNGKKDDVDIRTPFGSLSVKEGSTDIKELPALPPIPARAPQKTEDDDRHHSANVNISSSFFGAKVIALKFQSDDSSDKVLAFYRKDMGKYGNVVDCTAASAWISTTTIKTPKSPATVTRPGPRIKEELKVGTENNQRILAIKPRGNGSEFTLVYVRAWSHNDTN